MSVTIPIDSNDPFFTLQTPPLDGAVYTLSCRWNVRLGAWFMDVYEADGMTLLRAGLRLVVNWPLALYSTGKQPPGLLIAADSASPIIGSGTDPGLDDLGERIQLVYYTAAELGIA